MSWGKNLCHCGAGLFLLLCVLSLAGCLSSQKLHRAQGDFATYSEQARQEEIERRCADEGAMPGTPAALECRMRLNKPKAATDSGR